jgi:hypothetical protein
LAQPRSNNLSPLAILVTSRPPRSSSRRTLHLASSSADSTAACAASRRCLRTAYSWSANQWVVSPFNAASSPTSAKRSRAVSLLWSSGSCSPIVRALHPMPPCPTDRHTPQKRGYELEGQCASGPQSSSLFLVFSILFVLCSILLSLDDAHQVGSHAIFTEHLEDI